MDSMSLPLQSSMPKFEPSDIDEHRFPLTTAAEQCRRLLVLSFLGCQRPACHANASQLGSLPRCSSHRSSTCRTRQHVVQSSTNSAPRSVLYPSLRLAMLICLSRVCLSPLVMPQTCLIPALLSMAAHNSSSASQTSLFSHVLLQSLSGTNPNWTSALSLQHRPVRPTRYEVRKWRSIQQRGHHRSFKVGGGSPSLQL